MTRYLLAVATVPLCICFGSLAAAQDVPIPSLKQVPGAPARAEAPATEAAEDAVAEAASDVADAGADILEDASDAVFSGEIASDLVADLTSDNGAPMVSFGDTTLEGPLRQGTLLRGKTLGGARVEVDGTRVPVDNLGNFLVGFGRDHGTTSQIVITTPDGVQMPPQTLTIAAHPWVESRLDNLPPQKVTSFSEAALEQIAEERDAKAEARAQQTSVSYWTSGFEWPADGCISSDFGSRRILNGVPKRFHSGVDVAAPDGMNPMDYIGTEVRAPADGIVRLAVDDFYFEGGMVFIDHGQGLESAMMHLSEVNAEVGETVRRGEPIGRVGMTGRVTGPHLHWSLKWRNEVLLDPVTTVPSKPYCTD